MEAELQEVWKLGGLCIPVGEQGHKEELKEGLKEGGRGHKEGHKEEGRELEGV